MCNESSNETHSDNIHVHPRQLHARAKLNFKVGLVSYEIFHKGEMSKDSNKMLDIFKIVPVILKSETSVVLCDFPLMLSCHSKFQRQDNRNTVNWQWLIFQVFFILRFMNSV